MSNSGFVPFLPKSNLAPSLMPARAKVVAASEKPCLVPVQSLAPPPMPDGGAHASPSITLEKDGERITKIRVRCSCGQIIDLACAY